MSPMLLKTKIINVIIPLLVTIILCFVSELLAKNADFDPGEARYISRTFEKINRNKYFISKEIEKLKTADSGHSKVVLLGGSSVEKMRDDPLPFTENFDQNVTIVNLGSSAFTSFGVRENFEKAIIYEPDLFIIYSGHNNYWSETEELTSETEYLSGLSEYLFQHSNVFRYLFVRRLRSKLGESVRTTKNPTYEGLNAVHLDNEFIKFAENFQYGVNEPNVAVLDQKTLSRILEHEKKAIRNFKTDMQYIIKECRNRGIQLIFVTPVSNPNTYDYYLSYINSPKSLKDFSEEFMLAEESFHHRDLMSTGRILRHMEEEYPENGLVAAFMATYYDLEKNYPKSVKYELKTIELNLRSHRAKEPLENVIRGFEDVKNNVYVLDIERLIFSNKNTTRVSNMDLFIDYLHPSRRLYYFMGYELNKLIHNKGILPSMMKRTTRQYSHS